MPGRLVSTRFSSQTSNPKGRTVCCRSSTTKSSLKSVARYFISSLESTTALPTLPSCSRFSSSSGSLVAVAPGRNSSTTSLSAICIIVVRLVMTQRSTSRPTCCCWLRKRIAFSSASKDPVAPPLRTGWAAPFTISVLRNIIPPPRESWTSCTSVTVSLESAFSPTSFTVMQGTADGEPRGPPKRSALPRRGRILAASKFFATVFFPGAD